MSSQEDYIEDVLPIYVTMSQCIAKLAEAHTQATDEDMANIVYDAAVLCLSQMMPEKPTQMTVVDFPGSKH